MDKEIMEMLLKINNRLDSMESKFEKKFDNIDKRLDVIDKRLDCIDVRLDKMDKKIDVIQEQTANLTEFRTAIISSCENIINYRKAN